MIWPFSISACYGIPYVYVNKTYLVKQLMKIPFVKKNYQKEMDNQWNDFSTKTQKKWEQFGTLYVEIPLNGLSYTECTDLINLYSKNTLSNLENKQFSGTIYPNALLSSGGNFIHPEILNMSSNEQLMELYSLIFKNSYLWNSLHSDEFPAANAIEYQIVKMVAEIFGGSTEDIMGIVTTGGTQSLMNAVRSYINFGINEKFLDASKCVIIAPDTIHAAVIKASEAYRCQLILITTSNGKIDLNLLEQKIKQHKNNLVALFCSVPSYPYGIVDDVKQFASLAKKYSIGLHVDCCLGGFILNFAPEVIDPNILKIDGVTSLSVDTHKNGLAPKGSSVLLCKKIFSKNLMYHSIYAIPDWTGGLYGSPKDEGSQQVVSTFCAFITMLYLGKSKYENIASKIITTTNEISEFINSTYNTGCENIEIFNQNKYLLNVIALKIKNKKYGATYKFADLMKEHGFIFNTLPNDTIHFCITNRFADDNSILESFKKMFTECYTKVEELNNLGLEFDGSARIYGAIDSALNPVVSKIGFFKYFENFMFGRIGAIDAIKIHFLALMNPYHLYL